MKSISNWQIKDYFHVCWELEFNKEDHSSSKIKKLEYIDICILPILSRYKITDIQIIFSGIECRPENSKPTIQKFLFEETEQSLTINFHIDNDYQVFKEFNLIPEIEQLLLENINGNIIWISIYGNTKIFDIDDENTMIQTWERRDENAWGERIISYSIDFKPKKTNIVTVNTDSDIWHCQYDFFNNRDPAVRNKTILRNLLLGLEQKFGAKISDYRSGLISEDLIYRHGFK